MVRYPPLFKVPCEGISVLDHVVATYGRPRIDFDRNCNFGEGLFHIRYPPVAEVDVRGICVFIGAVIGRIFCL